MLTHPPSVKLFVLFLFLSQFLSAQSPITVLMCGPQTTVTSSSGSIFDSGGPSGNYQNQEYCSLLISSGCSSDLSISIEEYSTENCCDYLLIYDGVDESAPLLGNMQSFTTPVTFHSNSGKLFLRWRSDGSVVSSGFKAFWESTPDNQLPPEASFAVSTSTPAITESVSFSAEATNNPQSWHWNFGDGSLSTQQNPAHAYNASGVYFPQLIVTDCNGLSDTVVQTITVQEPPHISISPATFNITTSCSDTGRTTVTLSNDGQGDLLYNVRGEARYGRRSVLVYGYSAEYYSFQNITVLLSEHPIEYDYTTTMASDSAGLAQDLVDKDLLIIPAFPSNIDVWFLMSQTNVFKDFMANGGAIIVCGTPYYQYFFSATNLIETQSLYPSDITGVSLLFPTLQIITQDMPPTYSAPYTTLSMAFSDPAYTSLNNHANQSVVGYKPFGSGNIVYLGFSYQTYDDNLENLLTNALHWAGTQSFVSITPNAGKVAPGESVNLDVAVSTENTLAGTYDGKLIFTVNNPPAPTHEVPFTLEVTGQATLSTPSTSVAFGSVVQNLQVTQQLNIQNTGCDTLNITSLVSDSPVFTTSDSTLEVLPFSTKSITVVFSPVDTGLFLGNLTISGNATPLVIPLSGYSLGAPRAVATPASIAVSLGCGESVDKTFLLKNTGLGDLSLVPEAISGPLPDSINVLMMNSLTYYYYIPYYIETSIRNAFPNATFSYSSNIPVANLRDYIRQAKMVVLPGIGNQSYIPYAELGNLLRDYLQTGGTVIVSGTGYVNNLVDLGLTPLIQDSQDAYNVGLNILKPNHPLVNGINAGDAIYDNVYLHHFTSPDFVNVTSNSGFSIDYASVGFQNIGAGTLIYEAAEYEYLDPTADILMRNAALWSMRPKWLDIVNQEITLAPNDSIEISAHFDATNVAAGNYQYTLKWNTNDQAHPLLELPVSLNVTGSPELASLTTSLNFGIIQQFAKKDLKIAIENRGCDTLFISDVTSSNSTFYANYYDGIIMPFSKSDITLRFNPLLPGAQNAVITILSDGGTSTVNVSGIAVGAPLASTNPGSLEVNLTCDAETDIEVTLDNAGQGNLFFNIGNVPQQQRIAVMEYGAYGSRVYNIKTIITQAMPNVHFIEIQNISGQALADSLKTADALIIPSISNYEDVKYIEYASPIADYMENGGQVVVMGIYYLDPIAKMGLFSVVEAQGVGSQEVKNINKRHPITQDLPDQILVNDGYTAILFPAIYNMRTLLQHNGNLAYLSTSNRGAGSLTYWGNNFDYTPFEITGIMENLVRWINNPIPEGVQVDGNSGNVPAGETKTITVHFDGHGIPGGTYAGQIHLVTNDPQHNPLVIPITMNLGYWPCADFDFTASPCSNSVDFEDHTTNPLTSWYWQFGDGAEAFAANPSHNYTVPGNYDVILVGCNSIGCDTVTKTVAILPFAGPINSSCQPQTTGFCCNTGVNKLEFAGIDNSSADASAGYEDFSCNTGAEVITGEQYPIKITTSNQLTEYVRVWIDYNNNGVFNTNESVFNDYAFNIHEGFITIPNSAVKNTPLRLRVASNYSGVPTACGNLENGQAEDYRILIKTTSATEETQDEMSFSLYPNPATDDVWLQIKNIGSESATLEIRDMTGRLVKSEILDAVTLSNGDVKLPEMPAGAYWVKIQSGDAAKVEKLIKLDK